MNKLCKNCCFDISKKPSEMKRCNFCSLLCKKQFTKNQRKTTCETCGKIFYPEKRKNRKHPKFCSRDCMGSSYAVLDYNVSFLKNTLEFMDGFLLSDGHVSKDNCHFSWSVKYQGFSDYIAENLKFYDPKNVYRFQRDHRSKRGGNAVFRGWTKCHPDLKKQRERWYHSGKKTVPEDVLLTPRSVMMWYLGDGFLSHSKTSVILSTDSFSKTDNDYLVEGLKLIGITSYINRNNRITINLKSIRSFFNYIGWESPVKCYDYKFNVPNLIKDHRMTSEIADDMNVPNHTVYNYGIRLFPKSRFKSVNNSLWWNNGEELMIRSAIINSSYSHRTPVDGYNTTDRDMSRPQ